MEPQPTPADLMTTQDLAAYLDVSPVTLAQWRSQGRGPKYLALSRRKVLYRRADVNAWMDEHLTQSTAEARERDQERAAA